MYRSAQQVFVYVDGEVFQGHVNTITREKNWVSVSWSYRMGRRSILRPKRHAYFDPKTGLMIVKRRTETTPTRCYLIDSVEPVAGQKVRVHYHDRVLEGVFQSILYRGSHFAIKINDTEHIEVHRQYVSFTQK